MAGFEAPIDSIRGSEAYKDWLMRFAEHERSAMVDLVDDALAAYAKARDYRVPLRSDEEYCPVMTHATIRVPGLKAVFYQKLGV